MFNQKTAIQKLTYSSVIIAIYVIIMYVTQSFSFGAIQVRLATALYALAGLTSFFIIPLGLANSLGNILGGQIYDIIGGFFAGTITSYFVYRIKKRNLNDWLIMIPIIFVPGLLVPIWLSILYQLNYFFLFTTISLGQVIPSIIGVLIYQEFKKRL